MQKGRLADTPIHKILSHLRLVGYRENELKMGLDHGSNMHGYYSLYFLYLRS